MFFVNWKSNYIQKIIIKWYFSILHLNKDSLALLNIAMFQQHYLHFCISTWSTRWKVYLFCINMFKFSAFPHIWHPLVLISTLVILSSVRNASPSRGEECEVFHRGHFGDAWLWTIITIFETTNNLSASWPLCVSKRQHFTTRQEPPTHSMLSPTWILYFCWTKISFVFPVLTLLRDGRVQNADVRLREMNLGFRLICQQICPEIPGDALCLVTTCCEASSRRAYPGSRKPRWTEINTLSSSTMLTQIKWKIHRDVKQRKTKTTKWMHRLYKIYDWTRPGTNIIKAIDT